MQGQNFGASRPDRPCGFSTPFHREQPLLNILLKINFSRRRSRRCASVQNFRIHARIGGIPRRMSGSQVASLMHGRRVFCTSIRGGMCNRAALSTSRYTRACTSVLTLLELFTSASASKAHPLYTCSALYPRNTPTYTLMSFCFTGCSHPWNTGGWMCLTPSFNLCVSLLDLRQEQSIARIAVGSTSREAQLCKNGGGHTPPVILSVAKDLKKVVEG